MNNVQKTVLLLCFLSTAAFAQKIPSGTFQPGSIVNGKDGKPVGVIFQYDAATQTGYIVSLADTQLPWGEVGIDVEQAPNFINSSVASVDLCGLVNTAAIITRIGFTTDYASLWCLEYSAGGLAGWYLPSCGELNLLLANRSIVNQTLEKLRASPLANTWHWTSSEGDERQAWCINFSGGDNYPDLKTVVKHVRAIRQFHL